jgi:hypothetical protein
MRWRWQRSACPSGSRVPRRYLLQSHSESSTRQAAQRTSTQANATRTHLCKSRKLIIDRPDGLLYRLLKRTTDTHHLTDALHAATEQPGHTTELLEVPTWDFDDNIVKARLEARRRDLCDRVLDLVERDAEPELGRDEGQRVARRFGRERGGPRKTRVHLSWTRRRGKKRSRKVAYAHLDNAILARRWIERVLDVALANNPKMTDNVYGSRPQHVIVDIRERLRRRDDDRVARMNTQGVKVLPPGHNSQLCCARCKTKKQAARYALPYCTR